MADRNFSPVQALDKQIKILSGKINIAADASVSSHTILGVGASGVTRTATGTYTITLDDKYPELVGISMIYGAATAVDLVPQIVSETVSSTKIITFKLLAGATATNPSAVGFVFVTILLKNSTIAP